MLHGGALGQDDGYLIDGVVGHGRRRGGGGRGRQRRLLAREVRWKVRQRADLIPENSGNQKVQKYALDLSLYLDIEETDGTLYLSQTPSARRRSLEIINDVNFVIFDAAFLEDYLTFIKIYSFNCLSGFSSIIAMLT